MNYDKIISATYNWFSFSKVIWFLLFFWLALPILFLVPLAFEYNFFYVSFSWAIQVLYVITYITIILGILILIGFILDSKNFDSRYISIGRFMDIFFLVFCELFFIFVWNKNKKFRFTQILLILGSVLLFYYNSIIISQFIFFSLAIFLFCYFLISLYNFFRLSFSLILFFHKDLSILDSIEESWRLTHKRVSEIAIGYFFCLATVLVVFIIISIVLGAIANLLLINYLTISLSYRLSVIIASLFALAPVIIGYHLGFMELYFQLLQHHDSDKRVKRLLVNKVSSPRKTIVKKSLNKKPKKKVKKNIKNDSKPPVNKKSINVKKKVKKPAKKKSKK